MPYRAARISALLQPGLIARSRMPNTAGRVAETVVKRNLFALEDLAVRAQAQLYREAFNAIRETAEGAGTPDNAWQQRVNAGAERILKQLAQDVRTTAQKALLAAFDTGYYGRAWVLDMMTRPDVPIKSPMVSLSQRPMLEAATYSDAAQLETALRQWLAMYGDELDILIPQIRVAVSSGMTNGEGIDAIMRRVRSVMGVDTDRRFGPVGSAERRGYRANFNRVQVITRTVVNQASNQGAWEAYQRNADVVSGYSWVTARDERACDRCAALDGTTYKLTDTFRPPAHPNCRCTVMPVLSPDLQVRFSDPPRETFEEWAQSRGIAGLWSFQPTMERLL